MYFSTVFSLCLNLVAALLDTSLTCNFYEDIGMNNEHYFTNPNWPSKYKSGDSCRWEFKCHDGFVCRLRCRDVGLPQSDGCHIDNLLVSPSGDLLFRDAKTYCGRKRINVKSTGNRISMALKASYLSPGGRFRCSVKTSVKEY